MAVLSGDDRRGDRLPVARGADSRPGWEWQNPPRKATRLTRSICRDKLHGGGGVRGRDPPHADGGFRWDNQPTRLINNLNGVRVDAKRVFAIARGLILETRNAGERWNTIKTPAKDHLYAVTFAPMILAAVGRSELMVAS